MGGAPSIFSIFPVARSSVCARSEGERILPSRVNRIEVGEPNFLYCHSFFPVAMSQQYSPVSLEVNDASTCLPSGARARTSLDALQCTFALKNSLPSARSQARTK